MTNRIKVATQLTLRWGDELGLLLLPPGRPAQSQDPYKWKKEAGESVSEWCNVRKTEPAIAGSEMEEETMTQGTQAVSRGW